MSSKYENYNDVFSWLFSCEPNIMCNAKGGVTVGGSWVGTFMFNDKYNEIFHNLVNSFNKATDIHMMSMRPYLVNNIDSSHFYNKHYIVKINRIKIFMSSGAVYH